MTWRKTTVLVVLLSTTLVLPACLDDAGMPEGEGRPAYKGKTDQPLSEAQRRALTLRNRYQRTY